MLQWYICCHSRLYSLVVPTERSDEGTKNDKEISHIDFSPFGRRPLVRSI